MASRIGVLFWCLTTLFASITAAVNVTYSSFVQDAPNNQIYGLAVNVPSPAATDDLYFSFRGPASSSWVAFGLGGQGEQMQGALMFVVYRSEDGKNITVSPRLGTGHAQPQYTSDVKVTIMNSSYYQSGNDGGYFVDFHCTNCRSWAGGNRVDVTNTAQAMILALGPDGSFTSDELDADIRQHSFGSMGGFTLNLKQATGPGGVPPGADLNQSSGSSGGGFGQILSVGLHALLTLGGFVVVLPCGYLALRVFERVWMHWVIQSFGLFVIVLGCLGGIAISKRDRISPNLTNPHQIVGLIAFILILTTWTAGLLGHLHFRRTQKSRSTISQKSHRILGPATVSIGLLNGILGFHFAGNTHAIIGYIIVVALMITFVSAITMLKRRRNQRKNAMMTPAAQNFRQGQAEAEADRPYVSQSDEAAVPLQTYPYRTEYAGASGDIGTVNGSSPPAYGEAAAGYYAPPPGGPLR